MSPQESDSTYIQLSSVQGLLAKLVSYRFKLTKIGRESSGISYYYSLFILQYNLLQ